MVALAHPPRLGLVHAAATFAAVLVFLFVLLWAGAAFGALPQVRTWLGPNFYSPTLFTLGLSVAFCSGAMMGLLTGFFFNALAFLSPRNNERVRGNL